MGYWLLKRNIKEIGMLITLRDEMGSMIDRSYLCIDSSKAYSIHVAEILEKKGIENADFTGSLELEIFSTVDLVYPYPAFVINYYSDAFSTVVHSVGRVYNDVEDMLGNEEYVVREAGFDIYSTAATEPFVAFTNGPWKNDDLIISYEITNHKNEKISGSFSAGEIVPFQTCFLYFNRYIPELAEFMDEKKGTINVGHNLKGLFPRFVAGNADRSSNSFSITHSYYDSSPHNDEKSYWNRLDERFIDSSIAIPLFITNGYNTELIIYPILSASDFIISLSFFDKDGILTGRINQAVCYSGTNQQYQTLDFLQLAQDHKLDVLKTASARIECTWDNKERIPTRVKFGLNVGKKGLLPSNICFAPQLGNPNILNKKSTFKWSPIINSGRSVIVLTNSSSLIDYTRTAKIDLKIYREQDDSFIERTAELRPFGIYILDTSADPELCKFLNGASGWLTAFSENPNIYGWYYDFFSNGAVAADHIF